MFKLKRNAATAYQITVPHTISSTSSVGSPANSAGLGQSSRSFHSKPNACAAEMPFHQNHLMVKFGWWFSLQFREITLIIINSVLAE